MRRKDGSMSDDKQIPPVNSYEEMAEFWDTHSLADYWDQTESAAFEIAPEARRRYLVAVDREVLARVQRLARARGVSIESLVNLLLEQRLQKVESQAAKTS
jgi:CopG antitoxin of type II toxin-antitoxin system